ncbi:MAG: DNA (cytosine-5-)-methyltransferase [Anaerolineae bacterium]|nr:DNA (cytosine-5-)-methyltransferase [Anaerolineae bacterium]
MSKDVRTLRIESRITQRDLAKRLGVSLRTLSKWERGLDLPPQDAFTKLSEVLGCDADQLESHQAIYVKKATPGEGYTTARTNGVLLLRRQLNVEDNKIKVLDLFCGAGGLSYGFDEVEDFRVTCGIDLLHDRIRTFHRNHPYADAIAADVCDYPIDKLGEHALSPDVVVGGPPCQGFSSIRPFRTLTEGDKRNSLIEHFLLAVAKLEAKWFLFENVVGLLTHNKGKTFESLVRGFEEIGYTVSWRVINAANYGVPQNRERVFLIGNSVGKDFVWPQPTHYTNHRSMAGNHTQVMTVLPLFDGILPPAVTVMDAIHDLPEIGAGEEGEEYRDDVELTEYESRMRKGATQLVLHKATDHSEKMMEIVRQAGNNRSKLPPELTSSGFSSCYSRLDADKPSTTITVNFIHPASNRCIHPFQDRALTPREGARLQGFPDRFEFYGTRTQIVKQIGNAVPPLLAYVLAVAMARQF